MTVTSLYPVTDPLRLPLPFIVRGWEGLVLPVSTDPKFPVNHPESFQVKYIYRIRDGHSLYCGRGKGSIPLFGTLQLTQQTPGTDQSRLGPELSPKDYDSSLGPVHKPVVTSRDLRHGWGMEGQEDGQRVLGGGEVKVSLGPWFSETPGSDRPRRRNEVVGYSTVKSGTWVLGSFGSPRP